MKLSAGFSPQTHEGTDTMVFAGEKSVLNSELWHACAGPLVSLPPIGSRVVYFPQGHSDQVTASTNKEVDTHIPNYPSLPPQLICQLHDVTMHADIETDEVYAQMTLQPHSLQEQKDAYFLPVDLGAPNKQPTNYFCKTLTASDTSTHGGFSVPRRAAEKVFPPLDFSQQPPAQELIARDLHDNEWKFRHIFRGQPKRHLLTTGWSVFVSAKRLVAGDSVLFIWNEKNQLLLGIRRASRPQTVMPSSVLSSDTMHLGLLAAAAHAAAMNSCFTIFYNPRANPSEFVIPLAKYVKAVYHTRISVGMRFRMLFETEESSVRRYMGTITGISDLDPSHWPNSHWRSVKVGWDESTAGERQTRVSLWEIEPLTTFPMYPSPFPLRLKRPWPSGLSSFYGIKDDDLGMNSPLMWMRDGNRGMTSLSFQGFGITPLMQPRLDACMLGLQTNTYQAMVAAAALQDMRSIDPLKTSPASVLQFQQPQNLSCRPSALVQNQMLQPSQPQVFLNGIEKCQTQSPSESQMQSHLLHQQLQHQNLFNSQQQVQLMDGQQMHLDSSVSQYASASQALSSPSQAVSLCQQQNFANSNSSLVNSNVAPLHTLLGSLPQNVTSNLVGLLRSNIVVATSWPSKRATVQPLLASEPATCVLPQVDQLGQPQTNMSQNSVLLPPFPGRECPMDQEGVADQQCHLLFGVNIEPSSLLMQNGMSSIQGDNDQTTIHFSSNYMSEAGVDYTANPALTTSSCIDESGFLQSPENMDQGNQSNNTTFVKVYKSGSLGRSLDISQFSSYNELRSELAHMFCLEGELDDPLRSGWQLVFVDRENDVLLLGDGPWPEFVNSVWYIKILSPQEMQQMGKRGLELLNLVPFQNLPTSSCDGYVNRQDSRNLSSGIASVGYLDY